MFFNSITYALFLPIVFVVYWLLGKNLRLQNLFVVIASYIFYGWWDWRFLCLIALTSFVSWATGLMMQNNTHKRLYVFLNVSINLLILGVFKYFNFFINSFCDLFGIANSITLQLILPVGISFYTFQALSYSIDVYREKIAPTKDVVSFFAYVSFFPQLVAGPIERATSLLPQFERTRTFDYSEAIDGCHRILWGLFKKMVVADNCARYVDMVWSDYAHYNGSTLALAAILFSFQIYGDFSGYSDIAIGSARMFGIRLRDNFLMPYFSRNVAEFWKRWHISLNTWFVDYVYIPLGGSRNGHWCTIRNTFIIFLLSGLWHGANWTYVGWGVYHALLFIPLIIWGLTKKYNGAAAWKEIPQILIVFLFVSIGWIIFRAPSIIDACAFTKGLFAANFGAPTVISGLKRTIASVALLLLVEWQMRKKKHGLDISNLHWTLRWVICYALILMILEFGADSQSFIYFQF